MKITKGQLKRIIAEEHAVVYGRRKPTASRRVAKKRRLSEAKRELVIEMQSRAIANELLEEGFFDSIKAGLKAAAGIGGKAAGAAMKKAGEAAQSVKDGVGELAAAAGEQIEAMKQAGKDALAAVQDEYLKKLTDEITKKLQATAKELAAALKDKDESLDDDAVKGQIGTIVQGALGKAMEQMNEGTKKHKLLEAKRKRRILENRRRKTIR